MVNFNAIISWGLLDSLVLSPLLSYEARSTVNWSRMALNWGPIYSNTSTRKVASTWRKAIIRLSGAKAGQNSSPSPGFMAHLVSRSTAGFRSIGRSGRDRTALVSTWRPRLFQKSTQIPKKKIKFQIFIQIIQNFLKRM